MDTKDLRSFMRVYEEKSINKAAKQLFITPQGLSRVIHNLEMDLEACLFERTPGGMLPTESGTFLYENCHTLLRELNALETGIRRFQNRYNRIEIGFSCGVLNVFPIRKLEKCKQQYPDLQIQWEEASNQEIMNKVLKGDLDIGFVIGQITGKGLWEKELFSINLSVLVYEGHPLFEREQLSVRDLQGEPLISLNEKYYCYHSLVQRCGDFGFAPDIVVKTMEGQLIYRFCKEKIGLGIVVDIHKDEIRRDGLRMIGLEDSLPWKISVVAREERKNERMIQNLIAVF